MLGDCYAAAIVEKLSKKELMALDAAAILYQDTPVTPNGHVLVNGQSNSSGQLQDSVIVDMNSGSGVGGGVVSGTTDVGSPMKIGAIKK